jgi:hypothetical protein
LRKWIERNYYPALAGHVLCFYRRMKRLKQVVVAFAVVAFGLIAVRFVRHQRDRDLALPVIAALGGDVGSIPFEPFGTEYRVSFRDRMLSRHDLDELRALEPLARRNPVGIAFRNCGLAADDLRYVQQIVPSVRRLMLLDEKGEVVERVSAAK